MNPLNNGMNNNHGLPPQLSQSIQQMKGMMNMASGNPNQIFEQLSRQNPAFNQVLQMCNGKNPKDVFYEMCQQRGINPDEVLKRLQN